MAQFRRFAAASACAAALSLCATPALSVDLPTVSTASSQKAAPQADRANERRWRDYRGRHRDRIDAGDVLAGVLILGTIAAVAGAAKNNRDYRRYPQQREPYPEDRYPYRSGTYDSDGRGLDRAVDMCVDAIERDRARVGSVDGANRTGEGWVVSGALEDGAGFTCRIDNNGRIRDVDIGGSRADSIPGEDNQYGDDVYSRARLSQGSTYTEAGVAPAGEADNRPVWNPEPPPIPSSQYDAQPPDFGQGG